MSSLKPILGYDVKGSRNDSKKDNSLFQHYDLKSPRNSYEMSNESMVFQQNDLFPMAFPCMEEIRRQGRLCDVVLKVVLLKMIFK